VAVTQDSTQDLTAAYLATISGTLIERMGITVVEASAQRVVGTMPVAGNTQPYGLLHGGASCVLAETIGSFGAALHAGPGRFTVGIEISATHHRAAASGLVTGVATLLYGGRSVATYEVVISDDRGRRVCTSRLTCLLSDRVPASDGAGGLFPPAGAAADTVAARTTATGTTAAGTSAARTAAAGTDAASAVTEDSITDRESPPDNHATGGTGRATAPGGHSDAGHTPGGGTDAGQSPGGHTGTTGEAR
jgi:uncharacterized protein (TIGR00369 family)